LDNNFQKTLSGSITLGGVGLHTGVESTIILKPAKENAGLYFIRTDLQDNPIVRANVKNVVDTNRGTILQENDAKVHTVEHVLSALFGLGIDNAEIEISGSEPPILDGSSKPFTNAIKEAGIVPQTVSKDVLIIEEHLRYIDKENDIEINVLPSETFKITFFMDYGLPSFGLQYTSIDDVKNRFENEIAPARTFSLLSEITFLMEKGLIKGGSLENAVVFVDKDFDEDEQESLIKLFGNNTNLNFKKGSILNAGGLRFENEPVRHKVLDLIGDLSLLGKHVCGHIIAKKSGHTANIELVKKIKNIIK